MAFGYANKPHADHEYTLATELCKMKAPFVKVIPLSRGHPVGERVYPYCAHRSVQLQQIVERSYTLW
jgi:hypothetical protein